MIWKFVINALKIQSAEKTELISKKNLKLRSTRKIEECRKNIKDDLKKIEEEGKNKIENGKNKAGGSNKKTEGDKKNFSNKIFKDS